MKDTQVGLNLKVDGIGYVDSRIEAGVHTVKSFAGTAFHDERVQSVCVYDNQGTVKMYLKKTPDGVVREFN